MDKEKRKEHNRKYYLKNSDKLKEGSKIYYIKNKEKIKERKNIYIKEKLHNKCRCGNLKWFTSKNCNKCFHNDKGQGSVTRTARWKKKI